MLHVHDCVMFSFSFSNIAIRAQNKTSITGFVLLQSNYKRVNCIDKDVDVNYRFKLLSSLNELKFKPQSTH